MKILIPILSFTRSGGARVLSEFANCWIRAGHEVDFLCCENSMQPYFPTTARVLIARSSGYPEPTPVGALVAQNLRLWVVLWRLRRAITRIGDNYDLILANHSFTAWPVRFGRTKTARRLYYVQAYEPEFYELESGLKSKLLRLFSMLSYELRLHTVSNAPIYLSYKNLRSDRWVPPGIDFSLFYPKECRSFDFRHQQEIKIGCIGRRERVKGTEFVLAAFAELYKLDCRFRLHVAYGNLPKEFEHSAMTIKVPANDRELADYYRSLDILIAPGLVQFGAPHYPVMEAMACGIPVVTTGYLPATDSNSWLVTPRSSTAIVSAVLSIVRSQETVKAKVNTGLQDIAPFAWDVAAKSLLNEAEARE
jgi:glycosyltransferase involved in cell wall biosynthesis